MTKNQLKLSRRGFKQKNGNIYGLEFLLFENRWFTNIAKWFYDSDRRIDFPPISSNLSLLSNFIYDYVCWNEAKLLSSEYFRYNLFIFSYGFCLYWLSSAFFSFASCNCSPMKISQIIEYNIRIESKWQ